MSIRVRVVTGCPKLFLAKQALAARDGKRDDDTVSLLQILNCGTNFLHNPHELVAEYVALLHHRYEPIEQMKIRPTYCRAGDFDNRIMRVEKSWILDCERLNFRFPHPTNGFHRVPLSVLVLPGGVEIFSP